MRTTRISTLFISAMLLLVVAATCNIAPAQAFSAVLYNFGTKTSDPTHPSYEGIITQGRDGNLYSTTPTGVTDSYGDIFKITPSGRLTVLYRFGSAEGYSWSGLTLGTNGSFYGTTYAGSTSTYGTVFKITPKGSFTPLYSFTNSGDGAYPYAPPIQGSDGNFYGTTTQANIGYGTIYKMTPTGKLTTIYSFDGTQGYYPFAPLVEGNDGNFYGITFGGAGTVFKVTPGGKFTTLYNFDQTHGYEPIGPLVQGSDGDFYGTTIAGGKKGAGVIFKITASGKLTVLHSLNGTSDGRFPWAGLVQATDGNFYGSTNEGGKKIRTALQDVAPFSESRLRRCTWLSSTTMETSVNCRMSDFFRIPTGFFTAIPRQAAQVSSVLVVRSSVWMWDCTHSPTWSQPPAKSERPLGF